MTAAVAPSEGCDRVLLVLLCLALYLPGLTALPPVDRDEARFAQATKQMLENADFVRPRFQTAARFNKPIGIYWMQALAVALSGARRFAIWPYRLPSVFGAVAAVLLTQSVGRWLFDRRTARLGAALLASSALLVVEAHLATTDAVLLACVVGAHACLAALYAAWRSRERVSGAYAAGFWVAQGLGILVKGPVVPLVSGLTLGGLALLDRRWPAVALHWRWGVGLLLAMVLPWGVAVGMQTDWTFFAAWIGGDLVPKLVGGQESHGAPPGVYLLLVALTFWPASCAVGFGLWRAIRHRSETAERFCLAWIVPTWLFFEAVPTKLPHYVLPVYPALALLVARAVLSPSELLPMLRHSVVRGALLLWGGLTCAVAGVVLFSALRWGSGISYASVAAAGAVVAVGIVCVQQLWGGQPLRAAWMAVAGGVVIAGLLWQRVLPDLQAVWLSRAVGVAVAERGGAARPLAAVGYHEPSLVFLVGTGTALVDAERGAVFLREQPAGLVVVSDDQVEQFQRAAVALGIHPRELWSIDGINYSKGRRTRLQLFEAASG